MKNNKQWLVSNDCYGNLAQAIIYQAAKDYVYFRMKFALNKSISVSGKAIHGDEAQIICQKEVERLKRFFTGRWFAQLNTQIDGKELLRKLDWKIEKKLRKRKKTVDK